MRAQIRKSRHPGATLLLVEDDPDGREALERILKFAGFETVTVPNGKQALEYLQGGPRPSVILLDVMMPVMDGVQFRGEQQKDKSLADIPVVVLSAQGDLRTIIEADEYLDKPLEYERLIETIDRILGNEEEA